MAFKNYDNNKTQVTNTTYSQVSFSNPESKVDQTRFSVSYFNKLLKLSLAKKIEQNNNQFATYDTDNQVSVYVSFSKAKILLDLIRIMKEDDSIHNVCIELKGGLLTVSDGTEYGVNTPCFSITYGDENGNVNSIIYQTKSHNGAYNYNDGSYETKEFVDLELDSFETVLEEYYKASTYAVAATVMEASMYKRNATNTTIYAIAEKVGATTNKGGGYSNKTTFLNNDNSSSSSNSSMNDSDEYSMSSFDDIHNAMQ